MKNFGATDLDFEIRLNTNSGDVVELEQVMIGLKYAGITNTKVDKTLKRGQAYYTGVVFEVFDTDPENTRSLFGGGRYNNLLELFSNDNMPAVGFGAGDVSIKDFLATHDLLPKHRSTTDLMLVLQGEPTVPAVIEFNNIVKEIIETGVNVSTDQSNREKGDMYKVAEKQALSYICFVTEESLKNKELILKNMQSREEFKIKTNKLDEIRKIVKT
jgi:histidyl-tRNA synthetase